MAIVTVIGASGMSVQVTVEGTRMQSLASSYAQQILTASGHSDGGNNLTSMDLVAGSNAAPSTTNTVVQGVVTTGGAFSMEGNYTHLVVGAGEGSYSPQLKASASVSAFNAPVTVNGSGITSNDLSVLVGNLSGTSFYTGNYNGTFISTAGDTLFNASGKTGNWTIATGAGNDTIIASLGTNNIRAGEGDNLIELGSSNTNYVASEGQDTIRGGENASNNVTILGGNSLVELGSNSLVVDSALIGSKITVGIHSTVFGGTGSTVNFTGANGTVVGTLGDTISAAGDLQVYHGSNQTLSVSGALQFISGTGNTSITAGSGTIWGANSLNAKVDTSGRALFTANQPSTTGSQYIDASSSKGTLEAWTGAGDNTIIGGTGADHFVFGTQYENSNGNSYATVTGGSGAANTFGVLAGHNGGDITITDFAANSDNKFFMYNYKPADADQAVKNLLATATVKGGNTTLQLDNNMKVTFLGVTDLKSSSIDIS